MKGKNHLISGILFIFILIVIDFFTTMFLFDLIFLDLISTLMIFYLFFAGILLPDADKFGSLIFVFFLPFALASLFIGFIMSTLKGKRFKHRGVLHSKIGIIVTSFISAIIVYLFLSIFSKVNILFLGLFFLATLIGQVIHLLFD